LNNLKKYNFDRSGLAALSDLQFEDCQNIFSVLEEQQADFLDKASEFRSKEYLWPNDPLHCWSRIWEYPYVYYHLEKYLKHISKGSRPVVADVGSAVTFFPFAIAQIGYKVICTDIDAICEKDISLARQVVKCSPGCVEFRLISGEKLPFTDGECDALYCISVLEHIPSFENTVTEMSRVLKPGGLCLITCDLDLDCNGKTQLNVNQFMKLVLLMEEYFVLVCPDKTVHPVDMLTNINSPFPSTRGYKQIIWDLVKQKIIKPMLGRKPGKVKLSKQPPLAVLGLVLERRQ
jgi:ubiquinone/menaquinone biosynthesis C-methylase UbiE